VEVGVGVYPIGQRSSRIPYVNHDEDEPRLVRHFRTANEVIYQFPAVYLLLALTVRRCCIQCRVTNPTFVSKAKNAAKQKHLSSRQIPLRNITRHPRSSRAIAMKNTLFHSLLRLFVAQCISPDLSLACSLRD
jgi:hypothetical protein